MVITKRLISFTVVLALLVSVLSVFTVSASAATTYDCDTPRTITVTTGKKAANIKFECKASTAYKHTCSKAPKMSLKVKDNKTGKVKYYYVQGSGKTISSTLKLEKNKTYTVTVSYYRNACNKCTNYGNTRVCVHPFSGLGGSTDSYANGYWYIKSTKNISSIRIR